MQIFKGERTQDKLVFIYIYTWQNMFIEENWHVKNSKLDLYICIYIYIHICICVYIYI